LAGRTIITEGGVEVHTVGICGDRGGLRIDNIIRLNCVEAAEASGSALVRGSCRGNLVKQASKVLNASPCLSRTTGRAPAVPYTGSDSFTAVRFPG
jgi:hypothetical protein